MPVVIISVEVREGQIYVSLEDGSEIWIPDEDGRGPEGRSYWPYGRYSHAALHEPGQGLRPLVMSQLTTEVWTVYWAAERERRSKNQKLIRVPGRGI